MNKAVKEETKQNQDKKSSDENIKDNIDQNLEDKIENDNLKDDTSENVAEIDVEEEASLEDSLREEINNLKDEKLRLLADMENLRKRSEKEKIDSIKYGSINLARDILSPDDNLTRALEAIPEEEKNSETVNNLIDGLKMVQREFSNILEKHGIEKIEALNNKFDHNLHQAMVEIENDEVDEGIVIQEMQSGYTMHDRLLRPSMVGVSKNQKKNSTEKTNDDEKS